MGYLNGISIMIMVAYVIGQIYSKISGFNLEQMTQTTIIEFFKTFGE